MNATRLRAANAPAVVDVLTDAFTGYPVMNHVLGPAASGGRRLTQLIEFFVFRRIQLGGPMLGVRDTDGRLVGAAVMTLPSEPEPSAAVLAARARVWAALGDDCRERHDAYGAVAKTVLVQEPHHHLNMIGIRHGHHGRGLARPLLVAAIQLAADDPTSAGLSLTTETPKNVQLYEHFGFKVTGRGNVTPELETWGMFRGARR